MKNKFTIENTTMLLIDHQVGTIKLARNIERAEIVRNTRAFGAHCCGNRNAACADFQRRRAVSRLAAR